MLPARSFIGAVVSTLLALSVPLTTAGAATPKDWKLAVGWNQTVLPATAFGKSIGPFTPPASANLAPQNLASAATVPSDAIGRPGGIFICQDLDWHGVCGYAVQPLNECILLVSPWLDTISSFGPDPGATCFAFSSGDCNPANAQWSFKFPGDDSGGLATTNAWNDKASLHFISVPGVPGDHELRVQRVLRHMTVGSPFWWEGLVYATNGRDDNRTALDSYELVIPLQFSLITSGCDRRLLDFSSWGGTAAPAALNQGGVHLVKVFSENLKCGRSGLGVESRQSKSRPDFFRGGIKMLECVRFTS
ncbi:hypothetical protein B0H17DRAFT_1186062 [Mycena rosella]|uniref:Uncharacterized protein n=1 Tax=Mycena rosella TaxID=1033263 RepID=A0AAD7CNR1_MYCRO|nr:hypothetical protein B0H17DRAFT_1186062 [Mycena rosella]